MPQPLPHLQWLIEDPEQIMESKTTYRAELKGWKWNYGPELKKKGWNGVWQNFCRLYVYWRYLLPTSMGGLGGAGVSTIPDARLVYTQVLSLHGTWQQKRRAPIPFMPAFIRWLQTIGKPMDAEFLAWYPDNMIPKPDSWRSSYGNPRKLPASSFYLVNGSRIFSNQNQADGPFIMSIHNRGYKNAQVNFLTAPHNKSNAEVLTEYAKYKYPPLSWKAVLPYASTINTSGGAFIRSIYVFTPGSPKLSQNAWNDQMIRNRSSNVNISWNEITIDAATPPLYLSIEPQDLGASGSLYAGTLIPSINYCLNTELPLKYK